MYDFIAIGDIVTDAFIRLKDARIDTDRDDGDRGLDEICFRFGDKVEYENVTVVSAVGNSPNAAVSANRLGLKTALVANLGDDSFGQACLDQLKVEGVSTELISTHADKKSNYHYVLWYESDRTILVKHEDYEYKLPSFDPPTWLYLSSLGENTLKYHEQIANYLNQHLDAKLAFQPGTYQMKFGKESLKDIYKRTHIFFSNVEEAGRILGVNTLGIKELLKRIHELGPKIVVITNGPKGAYAFDGTDFWLQLPYPDPRAPLDRTGAGDSFSSTTAVALALGEDLPTALSWGAVNSMSVVQYVGAQEGLLNKEQIEEYIKKSPEEFEVKKI